MKMKLDKNKVWLFFLLFPFLCPRGFFEIYPIYKTMMTLWLLFTMVGMIFIYVYRLAKKKVIMDIRLIYILLYFGILIIETLIIQKSIGEGLQKMFVTPALFMFMIVSFDKFGEKIIDVMSDILLINLLLFCSFFNPINFQRMFDVPEQICFLGHIQVSTEMALLCLGLAVIIINKSRKKARLMMFLAIVTMFLATTDAGLVILAFLSMMYILYILGLKKRVVNLSQQKIFIAGTVLEGIMLLVVLYFRIDFGARYFVYLDGISKLNGHMVSGYGAYGVLIKTFWHDWENSNGMNYAHNEVLQLLLDGGIILLVAYIAMCIVLLRNRQQGVTKNVAYWFNAFLIAFLAVGICESLTEYNYFYIFLIINLFLPSILNRSGEYDYKKSMINGVR